MQSLSQLCYIFRLSLWSSVSAQEWQSEALQCVLQGDCRRLARLSLDYPDALLTHDNDGNSLLHFACRIGHLDIVCLLLEKSIEVGEQNHLGQTALHLAAICGFTEIVERLITSGSPIHLTDCSGANALHNASFSGHLEIVKRLVSASTQAKLDVGNKEGFTPLQLACGNHPSVAAYLIGIGADTSHQDERGNTALHLACYDGQIEVVSLLLRGKNAINILNKTQNSPLHLASFNGNSEIARLLISSGVSLR